MVKILLRILITAAALFLIAQYVPGITIESAYTAIVVALVWGLLGVTLRPILHLLTLPINIITLGLFSFIVNALLFWLLSTIIAGFHVAGFVPALVGSVLLAAVSWALHAAL
jgi:putative membrane protein